MASASAKAAQQSTNAETQTILPTKDLFRLDGRTILITGGAGALGLTIAGAILESGGDVVCLDLQPSPPTEQWEYLQSLATTHATHLTYHSCDTTSEPSMTTVFTTFLPTLHHPLRGLVACAGISAKGPSTDFPMTTFQKVMDVNITGTFIAARIVAREILKQPPDAAGNYGGASIVLIASMSGTNVNRGVDTTAYNSSKSAVLQMARSLAAEWGTKNGMVGERPVIRVNSLSPGYIRTAATEETLREPGMEELWSGGNMLGRLSAAEEFQAPVLFLLGEGSGFMTGADLRVDGGHCAW